jgi:hypothetical protein
MADVFQKILRQGKSEGVTKDPMLARDWFRDRATQVKSVNEKSVMNNKARTYNKMTKTDVGRMYMFFYEPKHKETLPYYDRFPLIIPIGLTPNGFMGLNLHYLAPALRARLFDALYDLERDDKIRESKKLTIKYSMLNSAAKFRYFKPCVKQYLTGHVRSRFLYIPSEEWDIALFLPTERFTKSAKRNVWKDSSKKILNAS